MDQIIILKNKLFATFLDKYKNNTLEVFLIIIVTAFFGIVLLIGNIAIAAIYFLMATIGSYLCDLKVNSTIASTKGKSGFLAQLIDINYIKESKSYGITVLIFALSVYSILLIVGAITSILVR